MLEQRKIVFFHPFFSNGGVERTNITLAKGLIKKGFDVTFLTTSYTEHFTQEIEDYGIEFHALGKKRVICSIFNVLNYLNRQSKQCKITFISCQYYVNVLSMLVSLLVKRRSNIRFVNSERNHLDEFRFNPGLKHKVIPFFVKILYRFADRIVTNSRETAEDLRHLLGREVNYLYNPSINERINELKEEDITEEWFVQDRRRCVIGVGRLSPQKDFETLLRAFKLFNNRSAYKLVILGEGPFRERLEKLIEELGIEKDVYLPGFVQNPYKFLRETDLFVLSSRYEGLPNVLIEALYLRVPTLSTNCKSGPKEILNDDNYIVEVGDHVSMAAKMADVIEHRIDFAVKDFNLERFYFKNIVEKIDVLI